VRQLAPIRNAVKQKVDNMERLPGYDRWKTAAPDDEPDDDEPDDDEPDDDEGSEMNCPRCKSKRVGQRLDGSVYCRRCGQRWLQMQNGSVIMTPSHDKRGQYGRHRKNVK